MAPFRWSVTFLRRGRSPCHFPRSCTWRRYTSEHHPLVETYGSMLHANDQHPRSRFLLLIQALEGLHGHETRTEHAQRTADHRTKRDAVITVLDGKADRETMRFLKKCLSKTPPTSLESALKAAVSDAPVDTTDQLAQTALVTEARSEPPCPTRVAGGTG